MKAVQLKYATKGLPESDWATKPDAMMNKTQFSMTTSESGQKDKHGYKLIQTADSVSLIKTRTIWPLVGVVVAFMFLIMMIVLNISIIVSGKILAGIGISFMSLSTLSLIIFFLLLEIFSSKTYEVNKTSLTARTVTFGKEREEFSVSSKDVAYIYVKREASGFGRNRHMRLYLGVLLENGLDKQVSSESESMFVLPADTMLVKFASHAVDFLGIPRVAIPYGVIQTKKFYANDIRQLVKLEC